MEPRCHPPATGTLSRRGLLLAAAAAAAPGSPALAQPAGPITIVVPSSPGSAPDVLARLMAQQLSALWKASVIVENKSGANGIVGSSFVAHALPDGRTLLLYDRLTLSVNPLLYAKLPYEPAALAGVTDVARIDLLFAARADASYRSWDEMLAHARAQPGRITVGTAGIGSVHHLSIELINRHYEVELVAVPYRGIAPAVGGLLGGELAGVITGQETVLEHIRAGKLRALAIGSSQRSPLLPDVPTLLEIGVFADLLVSTSFSLFAPAKVPGRVMEGLRAGVTRVLQDPGVVDTLAARGLAAQPSTGAAVQEAVLRDRDRFAELIRYARIKAE